MRLPFYHPSVLTTGIVGTMPAAVQRFRAAFATLPAAVRFPSFRHAPGRSATPAYRPDWAKVGPYVVDLFAATLGLAGALGTGRAFFAPEATGGAGWLHGLFLGCTALMLLGTIRFFVRAMDFSEPEYAADNSAANPSAAANARARQHEADGAEL